MSVSVDDLAGEVTCVRGCSGHFCWVKCSYELVATTCDWPGGEAFVDEVVSCESLGAGEHIVVVAVVPVHGWDSTAADTNAWCPSAWTKIGCDLVSIHLVVECVSVKDAAEVSDALLFSRVVVLTEPGVPARILCNFVRVARLSVITRDRAFGECTICI